MPEPKVLFFMLNRKHFDLFNGPAPRPFNYLYLSIESAGVWVSARGFQKEDKEATVFDQFFLPYKALQ